MARRTFRLKKDSPVYKKGSLYQEACDDGTQDYVLINREESAKFVLSSVGRVVSSRDSIENNPTWFEEVFQVLPEYATKTEIEQFRKGKL